MKKYNIKTTDVELLKKLEEIKCYAVVPKEYSDKLVLQAKFGVAVERWIEANQIDAVAGSSFSPSILIVTHAAQP